MAIHNEVNELLSLGPRDENGGSNLEFMAVKACAAQDVLQRLMTAQTRNNAVDLLLSKLWQFTLLAQCHVHRVIIENILTDDANHRLDFLWLGHANQATPQLFYSFFQFHSTQKYTIFFN